MYLSFNDKRAILQAFPELAEVQISNERYNYYFDGSQQRRKVVVRELSPTGNGYVYGVYLKDHSYVVDARAGLELRILVRLSLKRLWLGL